MARREHGAKSFQRAGDALFSGVLTGSERVGDLSEWFVLEETKYEGVSVLFAQSGDGVIEKRCDLVPGGFGGIRIEIHLKGFLFSLPSAAFSTERLEAREAG